jgi:hypothetical protein
MAQDRSFTAHLTGEPYTIAWRTAGAKSYKGVGITVRRAGEDVDMGAYQFGVLKEYSDAELQSAGHAFAAFVDALRAEVKRRAEAPKDPRDAKISELEKAIALATDAINALTAENARLKTPAPATPASKPAATPASNGSAESELANLPF